MEFPWIYNLSAGYDINKRMPLSLQGRVAMVSKGIGCPVWAEKTLEYKIST